MNPNDLPLWPFILLAALLAALVALYVPRRNRRIEAGLTFRNTLLKELKDLYPEGVYHLQSSEIKTILKDKHYSLNTAVEEYRHFVSKKKQFDTAWDNYSGIGELREKEEAPRYGIYTITGTDAPFSSNPKKLFINNVEALLSFVKET